VHLDRTRADLHPGRRKTHGNGQIRGIWDYIPLKKIRSTILKEKDIDLLSLSVELSDMVSLEYVFQVGVKEEIYRTLEQLGGGLNK
jgi:hypothetical protein